MASNRLWRDRIYKTVILDSSSILMLFEYSIDLEGELSRLLGSYKIFVPKPIVNELKNLSIAGKGKKKINSKAALKLIKKYETIDITHKKGDEAIIDIASKLDCIVVTNDKQLKRQLKKISISTVFIRGKQKLEIE